MQFLSDVAARVEEFAREDLTGDSSLVHAARYAMLGGGKCLRPALVIAAAQAFGRSCDKDVLSVATAYEYIHTYSLIHDDLPVMDNDEIRRGRSATHIAFGVETAVLAGAYLLVKAFDLVRDEALRKVLEESAGVRGMVGGQALDILSEDSDADEELLIRIHSMKTAALIRGAIVSGAFLANGPDLHAVGNAAGLAFQIVDDLLDVESTSEAMGKPVGRDDARGKRTYPAILGISASRERAESLIREAEDGLKKMGKEDTILAELVRFVLRRER